MAQRQELVTIGARATAAKREHHHCPQARRVFLKGMALGGVLTVLPIAPVVAQGPPRASLWLAHRGAVRLSGVLLPGASALFPVASERVSPAVVSAVAATIAQFEAEAPSLRLPRVWRDRYGELEAVVTRADGSSVQAHLLARGLAVVWPVRALDHRPWLRLEAAAREAGQGIWADLRPSPASPALAPLPRLQLVTGTVERVTGYRRTVFVDFDRDWRQAAGVSLPRDLLAAFTTRGLDPLRLTGRRILVRGLVERRESGPSIRLSHVDQVQLLDG